LQYEVHIYVYILEIFLRYVVYLLMVCKYATNFAFTNKQTKNKNRKSRDKKIDCEDGISFQCLLLCWMWTSIVYLKIVTTTLRTRILKPTIATTTTTTTTTTATTSMILKTTGATTTTTTTTATTSMILKTTITTTTTTTRTTATTSFVIMRPFPPRSHQQSQQQHL